MDIINPEIMVIGRRYYRINPVIQDSHQPEEYKEEYKMAFDEEPCNVDMVSHFEIVREGRNYSSHLYVPSMFYGFIIGKKGETKKRIELDTKATISIPKQGARSEITVTGPTYESVSRALTRITDIVATGRQKSPFTHFLSIPIADPGIVSSFEKFRSEVLQHCLGDRGLEERLFQRPGRLHLTLAVVVLGDAHETAEVTQLLVNFRQEHPHLFDRPMRVRVKGLEYMNDDPREVRVLYGKVDSGLDRDRLQELSDRLSECLAERRLLAGRAAADWTSGEESSTLLHMTVMNASFLSEEGGVQQHFDCSNVLRKYSDWDFGEFVVTEVHLSRLHGGITITRDDYYASAATLRLGHE